MRRTAVIFQTKTKGYRIRGGRLRAHQPTLSDAVETVIVGGFSFVRFRLLKGGSCLRVPEIPGVADYFAKMEKEAA
jgi:hypothetical protein